MVSIKELRPNIGARLLRHEDPDLLTGQSQFVDDINSVGMLHAKFVRSTSAHALIRSIDVERARNTPSVVAVFTAADIPIKPIIPAVNNQDIKNIPRPVLANDRVRFAGEAVAMVISESPYVAEDALELIDVDLDDLPVVTDARCGIHKDAPKIHENGSNIVFDRRRIVGDPEATFKSAPVFFERTFTNQRVSPSPMECRGIVAEPSSTGLRIYSPAQNPNHVAQVIADHLNLEISEVSIKSTDVGGSFGQKTQVFPEDLAVAWAAHRLGRPIKWIEDRTENLLAATHARGQEVTVRVAAQEDGKILALDANLLTDIGAYCVETHGPLVEAGITPTMIPGPYQIPNYSFRTRAVSTNRCPQGAYRGVGSTMAVLVHERVIDIVADQCLLDPAEVRCRNLIASNQMPYMASSGRTYDSGDYHRTLTACLNIIGYDQFEARRTDAVNRGLITGIGLASYVEYTAVNRQEYEARGMSGVRGDDSAQIILDETGTAHIWTTLPAIGNGSKTTFAQIAADAIGITPENIKVENSDTSIPNLVGSGVGASRSMVSGGGALHNAASKLRDKIIDKASQKTGIRRDSLTVSDNAIWEQGINSSEPVLHISDLTMQSSYGEFEATEVYNPDEVAYSYATHAAVVEIEPDTGRIHVCDYAVSDDCGTVINPMIVEGQIRGGVVQGIGVTLYEHHEYDERGQLSTSSFMDYLLPTSAELGRIAIESFSTPAPGNVLGAKGVGESGALGPPAAITNAISNALDIECNSIPVLPSDVRRILRHTKDAR